MEAQSGKAALILILLAVMFFAAFVLTPFALAPLGVFTGLAHGVHGPAMGAWHFRPWFPFFPLFGFAFLFLVLWIAVMVWVYKDAERRGMSGLLWSLLVFFGHLIGLIVFLIVRQDHPVCCGPEARTASAPPAPPKISPSSASPAAPATAAAAADTAGPSALTCAACHMPVEKAFTYCPHCGSPLQPVCKTCGRSVDAAWRTCPYCGTALKSE